MSRSVSPGASGSAAGDADAALDATGQALFRLGRLFGRQPLADVLGGRTGRALDAGSRRYQRAVFDQATHGWSDGEREAFARMFVRFATAIVEHPDLSVDTPPASQRDPADEPMREADRV
jgi:hypothetical protein